MLFCHPQKTSRLMLFQLILFKLFKQAAENLFFSMSQVYSTYTSLRLCLEVIELQIRLIYDPIILIYMDIDLEV